MNSPVSSAHDEKIESLATTYEKEGFAVIKEPASNELPFDLDGYIPDLVISKGDAGMIIEVKTSASCISVDRYQSIAQDISKHPGWRFMLVTLEDVDSENIPTDSNDLPTWAQLVTKLQKARGLFEEGDYEPASLYLWSIFEAALRKRAISQNIPVERLPASKLLNHMYSQGEISVEDIDVFSEFLVRHNRIAHGISESIDSAMIDPMLQSVNKLLKEWEMEDLT